MISLKKLLTGVLFATGGLLLVVLLLGLTQQRLAGRYNEVIDRGEEIVFRFNSLRDHLTTLLLEQQWDRFREGAAEIEAMNKDLLNLLDHPYIPAQYKLTLIDKVDIQGVALLARKMGTDKDKTALALQLHDSLQTMADQLFRLNRILVGQMNDRLVQFQKMAIGALTLITGAIALLLVVVYRKGVQPLLLISNQVKEGKTGAAIQSAGGACREVHELTLLLQRQMGGTGEHETRRIRPLFMAHTINTISNLLNSIINYSQLLLDECSNQGAEPEQKAMLEKILTHSGQISDLLQQETGDHIEEEQLEPPPHPTLSVQNGITA